jgi:hypothetical protein
MPRKLEPTEPITGAIATEFEGKTYKGYFTIRDGWLEVSSPYGSKGTWYYGTPGRQVNPPTMLAERFLAEIITSAARAGRPMA